MSLPIIHLKGFHFPLFPRLWPVGQVLTTFRFTESCRYELDGDDQWDWNKLCGINFTWPGQPLKAVMLGWRYNPATGLCEVAAYINDPETGRTMGEPMAAFAIGESFQVNIHRSKLRGYWFGLLVDEEWVEEFHAVSFDNQIGREVAGWFGGNRPAPHFIKIERGA